MKLKIILVIFTITILVGGLLFSQFLNNQDDQDDSIDYSFIDTIIKNKMNEFSVNLGQFALIQSGKIVYDNVMIGSGANPINKDNLFRIFQISMTVTATGVLILENEGLISLSDKIFSILNYNISSSDSRVSEITIDHLLTHTSGWNANPQSGPWYSTANDIAFKDTEIADHYSINLPIFGDDVVKYQLLFNLDADPGTLFSVNHVNYILLEKLIETVSGQNYHDFIQNKVLKPLGIEGMKIGKTDESMADPLEVSYANAFFPDQCESVIIPTQTVKCAYGFFNIDKMPGAVGWIANAKDLAKFYLGIDGNGNDDIVSREKLIENVYSINHDRFDHYGRGIQVNNSKLSNYGIAIGTSTYLYEYEDYTFIFLFNKHPVQIEIPQSRSFHDELVNELTKAL